MKRPAIFFDRDNTLIVGNEYLGDPEKVVLVEGAAAAIARARRMGFVTVVVSNQSGVARGLFDEATVHAVNRRMEQLLLADDPAAVIDRHEFCPFHPEASVEAYRQDSELRKPKPGMILQAAEALALDLERSWLIGDAPRDIAAGRAAGCRTILFTAPGLPASPAAAETSGIRADHTVDTLADAMDVIDRLRSEGGHHEHPPFASEKTVDSIPNANAAAADEPPTQPPEGRAEMLPPAVPMPTLPTANPNPSARTEALLEQILTEVRRQQTLADDDFSVTKLLGGIVQVIAIGVIFLAYLNRDGDRFYALLLFGIYLQMLVVALLIMGKQK